MPSTLAWLDHDTTARERTSEVLQDAWFRFGETVEVLRSEVDASGYDAGE
jgi:hypothetical protein